MINRAAPPGSMRYFSLLYAPADKRTVVTALYVIDAEIRESAQSVNHDVAHTRLQWWRAEVDRLVNGAPQHPAMRVLQQYSADNRAQFAQLHELLTAADMDLARMTYVDARQLQSYCARSGGAVAELIGAQLFAPHALDAEQRALANSIGAAVRQVEMVRDLRQDACDGRLYLTLDEMDAHGLVLEDLRGRNLAVKVREALKAWCSRIRKDLESPVRADARLRPLHVLAALHARLLDRIDARNYDVAAERIELGPLAKPWTAWRAARRAR